MSQIPEHILAEIQEVKEKQLKELDLSFGSLHRDRILTQVPDEIFELTQLEVLNLSYNKLITLPEAMTQLPNLTSLDLRGNRLTALPEAMTQLPNLTSLDLRGNRLTALPEAMTQLPNLTSLDLSDNQLTTIPEAIGQLLNLSSLNLSHNPLTTLPEAIWQLPNLTSFDLSHNRLTTLPEAIGQLQKLISLYLSGNPLTTLPEAMTQLPNLTSLYLSNNRLTTLPEAMTQLSNLTSIDLSRNQLTTLPEAMTQLSNLTSIDLSRNQLTTLPEAITQLPNLTSLYLSGNPLTTLPEAIGQLSNLTSIDLSRNQLTTLPEAITQLPNLTSLYLSGNPLTTLPEAIGQLRNLTSIDLSRNPLTTLPEAIGQLQKLTTLDLEVNQLTTLPSSIAQLQKLEVLILNNNPLETPPPEIIKKGLMAIKEYFRQLTAEGKDYLYEAKLLIVGEAGAGKTSLAKKIKDIAYQLRKNEESTQGIEVIWWEFPLPGDLQGFRDRRGLEKTFRVNIWDFGGQEIYHATHQFFLTKRSLYALVADTRREDTDFYYWLNVVELLSDNSPLLIVKNEKQDRHREINERQLRGQFTNLKETLATNLATNRGLSDVVSQIKHYISHLPHVGAELPKTWVKVREALENDPRNYISLDEYLGICQQNGFRQRRDSLQLSGYLHDLGVCLHFQTDMLLKKTVILKPEWGTAAVYKVLDNETVIRNLGRFSRADLETIWHEPHYVTMQDELLQLMINFKLCYQIPGTRDYIAPQLLTANQPDYPWDETDNIILRYTYEFMPKGILTQFIVVMHPWIADLQYVWKSGVILEKAQTTAEVIEYYDRREIKIRIAGLHKKELLTIVTYELDKIHDSYRRLKYDKLIPCNCRTCKNSQEPHFYPFEVLQKFRGARQQHIQCQQSFQMVNVLGLIDDVLDESEFYGDEKGFDDEQQASQTTHVKRLIKSYERRLRILKEQRAEYGKLNVPPEIVTQIEDIETKLKSLRAELN